MLDTSMAAGPLPLFIAPIRTTAEKLSEIFAVVFLFTSKRLWVMQLSLSSDGCAITALGTKNTITAARATFISSPRSAPGGPGGPPTRLHAPPMGRQEKQPISGLPSRGKGSWQER